MADRFTANPWLVAALALGGVFSCITARGADVPDQVDFNRHVKPILSDRCFACHGPDEGQREADLRLDRQTAIFAESTSGEGTHVIKPGEPSKSELYLRITSEDGDLRMPPPDSNLELSKQEISIIRRWIKQGAAWNRHWSLIPLSDVPVPTVKNESWPRNEIDRFVLARLESEGLSPAPEANKERLIRRLSFDLTGLPPTLAEVDAFLADDSPGAYEKIVNRLLASPRYGERMAVDWLDVARYADTYGYQADVYRDMWPWRDWVVRAFNKNLPYDQFITWQLAGDLIPSPSREQILATAFNRHHRQTNEGGSIEEEFRTEYVADRVETFGTAFLGLTLQCARCHEHKYDPISQQDFYRLFAFFNSIDESGLYSHFTRSVPTPAQMLPNDEQTKKLKEAKESVRTAELELAELRDVRKNAFQNWLASTTRTHEVSGLIGDFPFESISDNKVANRATVDQPGSVSEDPQIVPGKIGNGLKLSGENNVTFKQGGDFTRNDAFSIALWMQTPDHTERAVIFHRSRAWTDAGSRGYQLLLEDGKLSASLIHFWPGNAIRIRTQKAFPLGEWVHVMLTYDGSSTAGGLTLYLNGNRAACDVVRDKLTKNITGGGADMLTIGQRFRDRGFKNGLVDEFRIYNRELTPVEARQLFDGQSLEAVAKLPAGELTDDQRDQLFEYFLSNHDTEYTNQLAKLKQLRQARSEAGDSVSEIMVMRELPDPRPTFLLRRGAYDAPGERVQRGVPESVLPFDSGLPKNRLGLARWLTDPRHPLTARVAVNRFWQSLFGRGFVTTPEDFGNQGESPSHPQLLVWLSKRFIDSKWDVKALQKMIVMSATYRQDSTTTEAVRVQDPLNALLARGARYRLSAEMIRDAALASSGLLVETMGGPPVKPYQPAGLWKEKSSSTYTRDKGKGSHRRSLYTYWKRTSPPPSMLTFDAAKRDVCSVQRQTTATPLQALVLLNDPQYVEAARALAERAIRLGGDTPDAQSAFVFRTLTSRRPTEQEADVLTSIYEEQLEDFQANPDAAEALLAVGDHPRDEQIPTAQLAALTVVAETVMNFDETITKR